MHVPLFFTLGLAALPLAAQSAELPQGFDPITLTVPGNEARTEVPEPGPLAATRVPASDASSGQFIEVDATKATFSQRGAFGVPVVAALTWDLRRNILYGTSSSTGQLLRIDPQTGRATVIGALGVRYPHALEHDARSDTLYVANFATSGSAELFRVDPVTAKTTRIGPLGFRAAGDLAIDFRTGVMFVSDIFGDALHTVDPKSGQTTRVGPFAAGNQIGVALTWDPSLGLIATDNNASSRVDTLWRIDATTGKATLVGTLGTGNALAMAAWHGADASWTNYGTGLAGTRGVPGLAATADPILGQGLFVQFTSSSNTMANGVVLVGSARASIPGFWGGTLLVSPTGLVTVPVRLVPTLPLQIPITVPPTAAPGTKVQFQGFLLDTGAVRGIANTAGLELVLGR